MAGPDVPQRETPPLVSGPLVRREVVLLVFLSIVAVGLFLVTRRMADWEHLRVEEEAAYWYAQGETLMAQGRSEDAAEALRRSVLAERSNTTYALALARALTEAGRDGEALTQLSRLRQLTPDNAEVHYRLARLFARTDDPVQATRHYYLALYSPESDVLAGERRRVGVELAGYLLDHGDAERASDILSAVAREPSDQAAQHLELGTLFERAGRLPEALTQFTTAADLDDTSVAAASSAGAVALRLGDDARAEQFLRRAVALGNAEAREQLDLVVAVRRLDPSARGLSSRVRAARLADGLAWADRALAACRSEGGDEVVAQLDAVRAFRREHTSAELRDADVLSAGVQVVVDAAARIGTACDGETGAVRAWQLIGEREGRTS